MRLVTRKQEQEQHAKLMEVLRASAEKTKLMGRMLKSIRWARDYIRNHPTGLPLQEDAPRLDLLVDLTSILERKEP